MPLEHQELLAGFDIPYAHGPVHPAGDYPVSVRAYGYAFHIVGVSVEGVAQAAAGKFLFELEGQLEEKGVSLVVEPAARAWLAKHGYDEKMGARPMARVIQEQIKKKLANELLFGELSQGGVVRMDASESGLEFDLEADAVH